MTSFPQVFWRMLAGPALIVLSVLATALATSGCTNSGASEPASNPVSQPQTSHPRGSSY